MDNHWLVRSVNMAAGALNTSAWCCKHSVAVAPGGEKDAEVRGIDGSVVVEVGRAIGACPPCAQEDGEVGAIGRTIEVQVPRAGVSVALGGDAVPAWMRRL